MSNNSNTTHGPGGVAPGGDSPGAAAQSTSTTAPPASYDAVIIGAGLGGLTAGAKLAKQGRKVLIIEQHDIVGGCATVFKRKEFTMEVGLHELDGLDEGDVKRQVFEDLDIFDNVPIVEVPEFFRLVTGRTDFVMPHGLAQAKAAMLAQFPDEHRGIKKFFKGIEGIRSEISRFPLERWKVMLLMPVIPFLYPRLVLNSFRNVGDFIDSCTTNVELQKVLLANVGYYGDDPYKLSMLYFSGGQTSYLKGGSHFIRGGSQNLSDYLARYITDRSGEVLLRHDVTEIITQDGRAIGIRFKKKFSKSSPVQQAFAKTVIANCAVPLAAKMLPPVEKRLLSKKIQSLQPSCSLLSIYIGFNQPIHALGNRHYSTFYLDDAEIRGVGDFVKNNRSDFTRRGFVFVDYSQIDSALTDARKGFGTITCIDHYDDWSTLSRDDYRRRKKEVAQTLFDRLEKHIPGIKQSIERYEVGTPLTIERYTRNPKGAPYGYAQLPNQAGIFRLPNKSAIPGLYFASAWSTPGGGFTGAILSGWICAKEILRAEKPASVQERARAAYGPVHNQGTADSTNSKDALTA